MSKKVSAAFPNLGPGDTEGIQITSLSIVLGQKSRRAPLGFPRTQFGKHWVSVKPLDSSEAKRQLFKST